MSGSPILSRRGAGWLLAGSVACWAASLCLPAMSMRFYPSQAPQTLSGLQVLTAGWIDMAALQFGWLANLALAVTLMGLAGWVANLRWTRAGAIVLLLATIDTLDLWLRQRFYGYPHFHTGYYLWAANNLVVAVSALRWLSRAQREGI